MRLIVTRPLEDAKALAQALERLGHEAILAPLLDIAFLPSPAVPRLDYQAILVSSANGVRALARHPEAAWLIGRPLVAVGPASTEAALQAGFGRVSSADGDVAALVGWVGAHLDPAQGPLLYASGAATTGDLKGELAARGFRAVRVVLYDARPAENLPQAAADALHAGGAEGVLLFSPRTARVWATLCAESSLVDRMRHLTHYCLSDNVARVIIDAFGRECPVEIASTQDEAAMLRLIGMPRTGLAGPRALA